MARLARSAAKSFIDHIESGLEPVAGGQGSGRETRYGAGGRGAETLRQHLVLRQLGVTQAQGYFYGKLQKVAVLSEAHLRVAAG